MRPKAIFALAFALSLCGCAYALDSAKLKIANDGSSNINVKLLARSDVLSSDQSSLFIKNEFDKCGAATRLYRSLIKDRANIEVKFATESFEEYETITRCLGDNSHEISTNFEKKDGFFGTEYVFTITGKDDPFSLNLFGLGQNEGNRSVEIVMPGEVGVIDNQSDSVFKDFKIDRSGSDTLRIIERYNRPSLKEICSISEFDWSRIQRGDKTVFAMNPNLQKCIGDNLWDSKSYNLKFVIHSYQSKLDLPIWVGILGAILGSGLLVNAIGLILKKRGQ